MRKGYRECYPLGYRLSSGTALTEPRPFDENYMALAISIIAGKTSAQALSIMGLTPEESGTHIASHVQVAEAVYMLYRCGDMVIKDIATALRVSRDTVTESLEYIGIDRLKRYRRKYNVQQ